MRASIGGPAQQQGSHGDVDHRLGHVEAGFVVARQRATVRVGEVEWREKRLSNTSLEPCRKFALCVNPNQLAWIDRNPWLKTDSGPWSIRAKLSSAPLKSVTARVSIGRGVIRAN